MNDYLITLLILLMIINIDSKSTDFWSVFIDQSGYELFILFV